MKNVVYVIGRRDIREKHYAFHSAYRCKVTANKIANEMMEKREPNVMFHVFEVKRPQASSAGTYHFPANMKYNLLASRINSHLF